MAVVFSSGVPTSPADLIADVASFAAANGWTVSTVTGGRVFRKDDIVVGVGVGVGGGDDIYNVYAIGATAYDSGAAYDDQTNASADAAMINLGVAGPYVGWQAYLGDEGGRDYLHIIVEIADGDYRHLSFGNLVKKGAYTGGVYVDGTYWALDINNRDFPESGNHSVIADANSSITNNAGHVWADYDGKTNNWQPRTNYTNTSDEDKIIGNVRSGGIHAPLWAAQNMKWNLRTPLFPVEYYANRPSNLRSKLGRVPGMRYVNLRNVAPEGDINIGGEAWRCYPIVSRGSVINTSTALTPSSGYLGFAYLRP